MEGDRVWFSNVRCGGRVEIAMDAAREQLKAADMMVTPLLADWLRQQRASFTAVARFWYFRSLQLLSCCIGCSC